MPWAYAVAIVRPMRMQMAYATTRMTVLASWMHVVCATVLARCTNVDARSWLMVHAIAKATNSMPWANVAEHAKPTRMQTAFATTWMTALEHTTSAAFATDQDLWAIADATTFQTVRAIAKATNLTPSAFVAEHAIQTSTWMAFATTWMTAWVSWMHVVFATA